MSVHAGRLLLEAKLRERGAGLEPDARAAMVGMLMDLRQFAIGASHESLKKSKYVMFAYWRVVAVYAGQFARVLRSVKA